MATIDSLSSVLRSHQRFMAKLLVEMVSRKEESGALMDSFSEVLRSSEEIMDGMTDAEAATELTTYKEVHRVAREKESAKLVEGSSRLLGSLSLHPDMKCDDIGFVKADLKGDGKLELVEDDLRNVFSSTCFPRLLNEDEYFNTLQIGYLGMGETEEGVPAQLRKELFLLLDWPRLSHSSKEEVKSQFDNTSWGAEILRELEDSNNRGTVKRTYKWPRYERVVTAEELRTSHLRTRIDILFAENRNMLCVLDASEYIDDEGTLSNDCVKKLPSSIRRLLFTNCSRCTKFQQHFLFGSCNSLTSIDFTSFHNVTAIPNKFLNNLKSLTHVDLSSFSEVTNIGNDFIYDCRSLKSIDVSGLKKLTTIGDGFLNYSKSLTHVDLSSFSEVTNIGHYFISDCESLTSIDVSGLKKLTTIGNKFLNNLRSLTHVDLSSFSEVTNIGHYFISYCESLTSIDVSGLKKLTMIGSEFLYGSRVLASMDLSSLSKVTSIGYNKQTSSTRIDVLFTQNPDILCVLDASKYIYKGTYSGDCVKMLPSCIRRLSFTNCSRCTAFEQEFLSGSCDSLTSIDFTSFHNVTAIPNKFLNNLKSLTHVDLSSFSEVTNIGNDFIYDCRSLKSIDVSGLKKLTTIGNKFLNNLKSLTHVDLSSLSEVTSIGDDFISYCESLTSIDVSGLKKLTKIGYRFLQYSTSLTRVDLSSFGEVTSIGKPEKLALNNVRGLGECSVVVKMKFKKLYMLR